MKNKILKIVGFTLMSSSIVYASGWRIPEQSSRSVALAGAYVANSNGADASYYNPANMVFNEDTLQAELSAMYIHLSSIDYVDATTVAKNSSSTKENKFVPTMFLSSKDYDGIRYGFSITAPGGLSKRWASSYAKTFAENFTLKIIEFNPVVAYKIFDKFSIAGGLRVLYSEGVVKSDGMDFGAIPFGRDMTGNSVEYGYNLALSYKPNDKSNLALTYRSNVDLKEEGNAKLYYNGSLVHNSGVSVTVPLPAVFTMAFAYEFKNTIVEFEYDKTYWSKYKELDFEYDSPISAGLATSTLVSLFDNPGAKNWKDTDAFRIGVTHKYNENLTLMAGFAMDENPAPEATLGFELPDSDAKLYSFGFDYKLDKDSSIGFGYLYDKKESRTATNDTASVNGTFDGASAHLVSVGYRISF